MEKIYNIIPYSMNKRQKMILRDQLQEWEDQDHELLNTYESRCLPEQKANRLIQKATVCSVWAFRDCSPNWFELGIVYGQGKRVYFGDDSDNWSYYGFLKPRAVKSLIGNKVWVAYQYKGNHSFSKYHAYIYNKDIDKYEVKCGHGCTKHLSYLELRRKSIPRLDALIHRIKLFDGDKNSECDKCKRCKQVLN